MRLPGFVPAEALNAGYSFIYGTTPVCTDYGATGNRAYCGHDLCSSGRVDGCRNSGAYTRLCCMVFIYGSFVVAASVHGAIGVRVISFEWLGIKAYTLTLFSWSVFMALLVLGGKAVYSVTFAGAGI